MDIALMIIIGSVLANLILAGVILFNNSRSKSVVYFFIMVAGITGWIYSNYLSNFATDYTLAFFWNKMIFATTAIFAWAFSIFAQYFPDDREIKKRNIVIPSILCLGVVIVSLSQYLVVDISFEENVSSIVFGWGIYVYIVFFLGSLAYSFFKIVSNYFKTKNPQIKKSIAALFWIIGLFLFFSIATNLLLPVLLNNFNLTNLAPVYTIFFVYGIAWLILRFKFLNIKSVATEILAVFLTSIMFTEIFQSKSPLELFFRFVVFLVVLVFSVLIIRSVLREIRQRQEMEQLNKELAKTISKLNKTAADLASANKDIKAKNIHLEKLLKMRSEFLDIASHQLKTPISVIRSTLSMFADGDMDKLSAADKKKFYHNMIIKTEKLHNIISDILRASEMDTEDFQINYKSAKPVQLEDIMGQVSNDLKERAEERNIKLEVILPGKKTDPLLSENQFLEQAIYNLVDNAIKYTKEGYVRMTLSQEKEKLVIKIKDSGIGIPQADQKKMFDKFSRAKNAVSMYTDGSGLGLFIVKKVVEAHRGGKITFSSKENQGTEFTIYLDAIKRR